MTNSVKGACLVHIIICFTTIGAGPVRPSLPSCAIHFEAGNVYRYSYVTDVSLNEANEQREGGAYRPVGFRFSGDLRLSVVWKKSYDYLIKLEITKSNLHSIAREGVTSDFKELRRYPVYFHWHGDGKVGRVYLPMAEQTISANLKKGIISMLQLQTVDGERIEVDASGECNVEYEVAGNRVNKKKTNCKNLEKSGQFHHANKMFDSSQISITTISYEFANDVITNAESIDKHAVYLNGDKAVDMQAKATQVLKLKETTSGGLVVHSASIEEAVEAVDPESELDLIGMLLGTDIDTSDCLIDCVSLDDAIKEVQEDFKNEKVAKVESPKAFIKLLPIFRQASKKKIMEVLKNNPEILPQLLDIVAAAQTDFAVDAAIEVLTEVDDYKMAERFVMATSFSSHPRESLLRALLGMFKAPSKSPQLYESIALALGAVSRTYCQFGDQCSSEIIQEMESLLIKTLTSTDDPAVTLLIVRAMRNARLQGTKQSLIDVAETSNSTATVAAAVQALAIINKDFASSDVLNAMSRIYHQNVRSYDSGIRTAALAVLLCNKPSVQQIRNVLLSTINQTDPHMAKYVLGTLQDLASQKLAFRQKLVEALNDKRIKNYNTFSPGGKANALTSNLGSSQFNSVAYRLFMQNAKTGVMKKSGMQVNLQTSETQQPVLLFSIYAQGLESVVDSSYVPEGGEEEEPNAGLSLDLLDVLLRPVEFFRGSSDLMSAVWNAPTEPVSALAVNVLTQDKSQSIYLLNGIVLQHQMAGVASIELSGFISISLWNQDAHSVFKNSGATVVTGGLSIAENNYLSAAVTFDINAAAFIDFITDVNFYVTPPQVCLRMSLDPFTVSESWSKTERANGLKTKAIYSLTKKRPVSGASYLLSEENSRDCTKLLEK